jgi:hypothetical protein
MKLLLSPHDDDSALFAGFTCQREHPLVVVVLDSWIQPNRGEVGCSARERARETLCAHAYFRVETERLELPDNTATEQDIEEALRRFTDVEVVYAPALQGGNIHHDMVAIAAQAVFGDKVIPYTTYTKTKLHTTGDVEIVPTERELEMKTRALQCFESQLRINRPHFDAVLGKSEWLMNPAGVS